MSFGGNFLIPGKTETAPRIKLLRWLPTWIYYIVSASLCFSHIPFPWLCKIHLYWFHFQWILEISRTAKLQSCSLLQVFLQILGPEIKMYYPVTTPGTTHGTSVAKMFYCHSVLFTIMQHRVNTRLLYLWRWLTIQYRSKRIKRYARL